MPRKYLCVKHEDAIFSINSLTDEWDLFYHKQILAMLSHLEENHSNGCVIVPVEFRDVSEL